MSKTYWWRVITQKYLFLAALLLCMWAQMAWAESPVYGPRYPPPGGVSFSSAGGDGAIARAGGVTWTFSNVALAATNQTWWGPAFDEIKISFDGSDYSGAEIHTYQPAQSDLPNGKAVWTGQTAIYGTTIYTRFTLTAKNADDTPLPLSSASELGLMPSVGAVVPVTSGKTFKANLLFEAANGPSGPFQPAYDLFDYYHSVYNLGYSAYSSFTAGFYFRDTAPTVSGPADLVIQKNGSAVYSFTVGDAESDPSKLTLSVMSGNPILIPNANIIPGGSGANRTLTVTPAAGLTGTTNIVISTNDGIFGTDKVINVLVNAPPRLLANNQMFTNRGSSATVTTTYLSAADEESGADKIVYTLASGGNSGGPPHAGTLFLSGNALAAGSSFTQQDVDNGLVTYLHGGDCSQNDDFQFSVQDGNGASIPTGLYPSYSFHIGINQPNRAPVALNSSAGVPMGRALQGTLGATNDDCTPQTLTFRIVSNAAKGTVKIDNENSGAFTYTPNDGATGADSFTFQVNDGLADAATAGTVTLSIVNQPPTATGGFSITSEKTPVTGKLTATDSDLPPQPLTFAITANGTKGTAAITDQATGAFTYTPNDSEFGEDTFTFTASDGELTSAPAQYTVYIRPNLKKGRIAVTNSQHDGPGSVVVIDPATGKQGIFSYGDKLSDPVGLAFEASGDMVVVDGNNGVLRIDRTTGAQTIVTGPGGFGMPIGIAVEKSGALLVGSSNGLFRINRGTGNPDNVFSGGELDFPAGVRTGANGEIFVTDVGAFAQKPSQVLRLDPVDGSQAVLSDGGNLMVPSDLAAGPDGNLYVSDGPMVNNNIIRINPADGLQTIVSSGNNLSAPSGLTFLDGKLVVASSGNASVVVVDPADGTQTVLASGSPLSSPFGIAVVTVDETAPTTSATPAGGLYSTDQSVALSCDDGLGSGCAGTYYCVGGGCNPETPYETAISVASPQVVRFFSNDKAGNTETVREVNYNIVYPPQISGTPATTVRAGSSYSFTPTASYATSFSIENKPSWASFDTGSGTLSGTPQNANIGINADIVISASNVSGTASLLPFTITVDPPLPTGSISINAAATVTGTPNVTLTLQGASSYVTVDAMQFSNDNDQWSEWEPYTGTKSYLLPPGDGLKTVYVRFRDSIGNASAVYSASITLDTAPPSVKLSALKDKSVTNVSVMNLAGIVTDAHGVQSLTINNAAVAVAEDGSFNHVLRLAPGVNNITVAATDSVGNTVSLPGTITLNDAAPLLAISAPGDNSSTANAFIDVTGSIDAGTVVQVSINGETPQLAGITGAGTGFFTTVNLANGMNTIFVRATDLNGKTTMAKRTVIYDSGKPSVAIVTPGQDQAVAQGAVTIQGSVADAVPPVSVTITDGEQSFTPELVDGVFQQQFVLNDEKIYTFKVTVSDNDGATTTVTRNVVHMLGRITINNGNRCTRTTAATLSLDYPGAVSMQFSTNGTTWNSWAPFAKTASFPLPAGDGLKTVSVRFKDAKGAISKIYTDSIILDATAPVNGTLTITPVPGTNTLSWKGFIDNVSGIAGYRLVVGTAGLPACTATPLYAGTGSSYAHSGIVTGTIYYYRLCAVDAAGNTSTGATASLKGSKEYDPPAGSVAINGGAPYTKSPSVTLTLGANDASGVSQVCISNSATCSTWMTYAASKAWTLTTGNGLKTVRVWFKDSLGNASSAPYSASITLDATAPTNGTVSISPAPGTFTVNWQGFSDALSGIAGYRLVGGTTATLACTATPLYAGTGTSFAHTGISTGTTYYYKVCAVDNAGNLSTGATATKKAVAEYDAPVGSVAINGGAPYTKSGTVNLALSATDASGVAQVCVSNTATCTTWSPYAATKSWILTTGNGVKTVNVWYKDTLGNSNPTPYSASITLDATAPVNGTLAITPGTHQATLNWQGFTDALSGIAGYRLVFSTASSPSCTAAPLYTGSETTYLHDGLTTGTTYYYRVCAVDKAGNTSSGAIASFKAP